MFTIKLFLSIIPIAIIALVMYKIDIDKEPKKVLKQIFISSMIVGLAGGLISYFLVQYIDKLQFNSIFVYNVVRYVFIVAFIEEVCKFIPAKLIGMEGKHHTSFYDTLLYFVFAGLGFACIENIMYVMTFTVKTAFVRGLLSVPGHILFSAILGIFIAQANKEKLKNNNKTNDKSIIYTTLGFTIASITHAIFNIGLTLKVGVAKAIIVSMLYIIGIYVIFIIKETSKINNFYIKNDIFKIVLNIRYIKANRNIIGIISSIIILLGLFNTFSVYTFVEKNIGIKYFLIILQFIFILIILYKKKLKDKFKCSNIVNLIIYILSIIIYIYLANSFLNTNYKLDYGYTLILNGLIMQTLYYILGCIKINKKEIKKEIIDNTSKEETKEEIDPEII